jgi:hypothetical protein
MEIDQAAINTLFLWKKNKDILPDPVREESGKGLGHQRFVLEEVKAERVTGEKAHRWLGRAQGYLVAEGEISLADCKYANVFA